MPSKRAWQGDSALDKVNPLKAIIEPPDRPIDKINDIKGRQRALYDLMVEGYNKQRADILQKLGGSSSNKDYSKADEIASKSGA